MFLLWFFGNGWNVSSGDDDSELGMDSKENLLVAARILTWILRLFPSFCLGHGLFYAINLGDNGQFVSGGETTSVWDTSILLYEVIFLILESVLYLIFVIQLDEYTSCPKARAKWTNLGRILSGRFLVTPEDAETTDDDDDVETEKQRIEKGGVNTDQVVIKNLTKRFGNGKLAVNNLSLGIPAGECFGLLGM